MEYSSWEANRSLASQEIPRILYNPKIHYSTHKRPPPIAILGQINPSYQTTNPRLRPCKIFGNVVSFMVRIC
jgi:hypothetical protein